MTNEAATKTTYSTIFHNNLLRRHKWYKFTFFFPCQFNLNDGYLNFIQKCQLLNKCVQTSSGTARIFELPLRNTTNTLRAPHLRADVAQSNAVSPAPRTITLPYNVGRVAPLDLQPHIPEKDKS